MHDMWGLLAPTVVYIYTQLMHTLARCQAWHWYLLNRSHMEGQYMRNGTCHVSCVISWRQNQRERLYWWREHVALYCRAALLEVKVQNIDFVCKIPVKECLCHPALRWNLKALFRGYGHIWRRLTAAAQTASDGEPQSWLPPLCSDDARRRGANERKRQKDTWRQCPHVDTGHGDAALMKPAAEAESHKVAAVGCAALRPNAGCGMEKIKYEQLSVKTFRASYCYQQHLF